MADDPRIYSLDGGVTVEPASGGNLLLDWRHVRSQPCMSSTRGPPPPQSASLRRRLPLGILKTLFATGEVPALVVACQRVHVPGS
jgi:hypothetical protein